MKLKPVVFALLLGMPACAPSPAIEAESAKASTANRGDLKIASWNMEFLAERDGAGCKPRKASDYTEMRRIADSLDADVIAFEEVESIKAAERVFDPARYEIVMENRPGEPGGDCGGGAPGQSFIRQAVGFAIRKDLPFTRAADVIDLQLGNPNLRSGVDITVLPANGRPLRLLAVHLKSGCFSGTTGPVCPTLAQQVPVLERWIDAAAAGPNRFIVLGDWNRRLAETGDVYWADLDDGNPVNSDLRLADDGVAPRCDPRFRQFIDHIVLDRRAGLDFKGFSETLYPTSAHASDHCPVSVSLVR